MPGYLEILGQNMGGQAAGGALGLALGAIDRKAQVRQAGKLQELEIKGQKQMTDYNMSKQLQMWKDTSYGPQVEEMKKAGINPALLYGMSGGGAQTTGQANAGISGQQAAQQSGAIGMGMQMQLALQKAQIDNINADTENKKAEKPNIPLTGENIQANTANLLQGINESKTRQALTEAQEAMENIKIAVAGATQNAEIAKIMYGLEILQNDKEISEATKKDKIEIYKQQAIGAGLDNLQKIAQKALTQAETGNVKQDTQLKWQEIQHTLAKMRSLNANVENIDNLNAIMQEANRLKEQANDLNDPTLTPQVNQIVSGVIGGLLGGRFTTTPGLPPAGFKIPKRN